MGAWGEDRQGHYAEGRTLETVEAGDVEGVCRCGYLTLRPRNDFERHNGGLTVKRKDVQIIGRIRGANKYYNCNACVNDWR